MRYPEEELIGILKAQGIDFTCSLPCEKIKRLLEMVSDTFFHVPLTREEEGVGICAGAALSGKKPAMFVQSSGVGNMLNALLSLTGFYEFPLAVFVSRRGVYKEKIEAQVPMGRKLPGILRGGGIPYSVVTTRDDFREVEDRIEEIYGKNRMHVFLLSPSIWEETRAGRRVPTGPFSGISEEESIKGLSKNERESIPELTRYEILKITAPFLDSKAVVCNLGFPSKELFQIKHQPSNFYMFGSMGMATPIGLGIAMTSRKHTVVIDGDGSLLMNPGTLATAAHLRPDNLTILAVDNGSYGSTGNQPTLTGSCVDLEIVAKGFGIRNTVKAAGSRAIMDALKSRRKGLRFIHILALPGNEDVPNVTLHHLEVKKQVQDFLAAG